jgi:ABC-type lipoprotein export system ATPase subunit
MSSLVELKNISKVYQSGKERVVALHRESFSLKKNDFLGIVGPSGAGKSTLLHILGGLEIPTQGQVLYNNKSIYAMKDSHLCQWRNRMVGFVFQFYHLIEELTVQENVSLPSFLLCRDRKTAFKKGQSLLQYLEILDKKDCFPSELSGGQKQKVAIARALINEPEMILCDEPTGNLDESSARKIIELLSLLNKEKGKTIVIVTHNQEIAKVTNRVFSMKGGKLVS